MDPKEKLIISKLLKLAEKQQKIITKLAQTAQSDVEGNIEYLKRAWTTAGLNSGVTPIATPQIEHTPGQTQGQVQVGETYTLYADGIPLNNDVRTKLMNTFKAQVKAQKPDLDGKLGIIFGKKPGSGDTA